MATEGAALRKRQQIAKANRTMFIWVAAVAVLIGFSGVAVKFLWQEQTFNNKVLNEKSTTDKVLTGNLKAVTELKNQVRVLNTNQALKDSMALGQDQPIRVVLDALPSEANSSALGASLQEKFLTEPGLNIETLTVDPVDGVESQSVSGVEDASSSVSTTAGVGTIGFRFSVSTAATDTQVLQDLLSKIERSIRTFHIQTMKLEQQGQRLLLTIDGQAFYQSAVSSNLKEKAVPR